MWMSLCTQNSKCKCVCTGFEPQPMTHTEKSYVNNSAPKEELRSQSKSSHCVWCWFFFMSVPVSRVHLKLYCSTTHFYSDVIYLISSGLAAGGVIGVNLLSSLMWYPTVWPTLSPLSAATLSATAMAASRLGWVQKILQGSPFLLHSSSTNWGIWWIKYNDAVRWDRDVMCFTLCFMWSK